MTEKEIRFRTATPHDAIALAPLINMAGENLATYLWTLRAAPGETPEEVGLREIRSQRSGFTHKSALVAEIEGHIAACLFANVIPKDNAAMDPAKLSPMARSLWELEKRVPNSLYINVLATDPAFRRQGIARQLLVLADTCSIELGKTPLSLTVCSANDTARRLYESFGFTEFARNRKVKEGWTSRGDEWVLMTKR